MDSWGGWGELLSPSVGPRRQKRTVAGRMRPTLLRYERDGRLLRSARPDGRRSLHNIGDNPSISKGCRRVAGGCYSCVVSAVVSTGASVFSAVVSTGDSVASGVVSAVVTAGSSVPSAAGESLEQAPKSKAPAAAPVSAARWKFDERIIRALLELHNGKMPLFRRSLIRNGVHCHDRGVSS